MSDMGWTKYVEAEEASRYEGCVSTALKNGHTKEEAEMCDDGSVGCPDCPFKRVADNCTAFCDVCKHSVYNMQVHLQSVDHKRGLRRLGVRNAK